MFKLQPTREQEKIVTLDQVTPEQVNKPMLKDRGIQRE